MDERKPVEPPDDDAEDVLGEEAHVAEPAAVGEGDEPEQPDAAAREPGRTLPRYTVHQLETVEDALGRKFCFTPEGRAVCGRHRKRKNATIDDEACLAGPTAAGPCRVHGAGAGPPMTAGGRYSKVLRGWRALYQEALADQNLLDTRHDLAMMDAALLPLVKRAEDADCPAWRVRLREAFGNLEGAIKRKQHARVGPLMRGLSRLIEEGAQADEVTADLMRHVDRRASRAHRINELEVRRDQTVSLTELTVVFARWIEALREELDDATFRKVLPRLRSLTHEPRPGLVGSADEWEAKEMARGTVAGMGGEEGA